MSEAERQRIRKMFMEVAALPLMERAAALNKLCEGSPALRIEVERLLQADADAGAGGFMANPTNSFVGVPAGPDNRTTSDAVITERPGEIIGPYKLLQTIGEGGFGTVYMAEQQRPIVRKVALKIIKLGMDTRQVVARFEQERQALALMDHPNIAKVLDGGATDSGRPYFVMELVKGIIITEYCDKNNLSARERLELFIPVCQAVQHAHHKGVIHRDIKPSNILVTLHDGKPVPKVIDFGVAKATNARLTEKTLFTDHHQFIGTPAYMSPEQAELSGLDIDTRADVYALGVLLYELMTGTTPFENTELMKAGYAEIQRIIREVEPPKPSTRVATLGGSLAATASRRNIEPARLGLLLKGDLDWIVMKALEKDRQRRYDTPIDMSQDVQRHLAGDAILAAPPSAVYRVRKFLRRHKTRVIAGATILGVLMLGIIGTSAGFVSAARRAESERLAKIEAEQRREVAVQKTFEAEAERTKAVKAGETIEYNAYVANIQAAAAALEMHRADRLRQRLDACPEHLRGWEWNWLNAESDNSLLVLKRTVGIAAVLYSPDSRRIATVSYDSTMRVWDESTGTVLTEFKVHTEAVNDASFSPDGTRIVTASDDRTARVWDAATGASVVELDGHTFRVSSASFSSDGTRIVTGSGDKTARVWNAANGTPLVELKGHTSGVYSALFSPDGTRIVTASDDGTARVWDSAKGDTLIELKGHTSGVYSALFSPDDTRIVTASHDGTAKMWDAATGTALVEIKGHYGSLNRTSFNPDGTRIVTTSAGRMPRVWDSATGTALLELKGHTSNVISASFSPDGTRIVTASADNTARVWDASTGSSLFELRGHIDGVFKAEFNIDGTRLLTASWDTDVRVWDTYPDRHLTQFSGNNDIGRAVSFMPDGARILTSSEYGKWQVRDVTSGSILAEICHSLGIRSATFSPDGARILAIYADSTVRVLLTATGATLAELEGHVGYVNSASFNSDGTQIITRSGNDTLRVWDAATGACLGELKGPTKGVLSTSFSPSGTRIVTGSFDGIARVWDAATGFELVELKGHKSEVSSACFSPDGTRIITTSYDKTARVWDSATGASLLVLKGHKESVDSASFSPDGTRIVTGSFDTTARVWDAITGACFVEIDGHVESAAKVSFSPDGTRLVTQAGDGSIRIFDSLPYRERFPAIRKFRDVTARLESVIRERVRGGAEVARLRAEYVADEALAHEERTAALAILYRIQEE
jgi:WD40 repeat protein/serine/threonine protein kinase